MKLRSFVSCLVAATCLQPLLAQEPAAAAEPAEATAPTDVGWPREFKTDSHTVVVFQPQVEEWVEYTTLKMRMAVAVSETGKEEEAQYGGLFAEVTTDVDSETRQVLLTDRKATKLVFPDVDDAEKTRLAGIMKLALPDKQDLVVSLDRVVAAVATSEQQMRQVEASDDVPPIFISQEPALLMIFIGEPAFEPVADSGLLFATNTNWDVFMAAGDTPAYFLRMDDQWLTTSDAASGTWQPAAKLPDSFAKLPADDNWAETRENVPGKPAAGPMKVFYSDRPAELAVIDGKPSLVPLVGAGLMYVKNTEANLFLHTSTKTYYFLSAGRWFTTTSLEETSWAIAGELPAEFAQIPEDHEKGDVLASVAGTPAATEAVIMASIPESATINRSEATLEVFYEGEPQFSLIPGTEGVQFALNSNFDVFLVNSTYYCCQEAVWFVSASPTGPWAVCDSVPQPIYTIPAEHPKHNVTYVTVNNSTPTTVQTSYTSGYTGSYVVNGLVMFGLGYWIAKERYKPDYWYWHRRYHGRPSWYGYGCRARWYNGHYVRHHSRYYGPYGGAGRNAIYNPRTGGWARSSYAYGPRGSAYSRSAYNPYTNTFGRQTRVSTPYGTGTRGVVSRNGNWARGGTYSNRRGTVGAATGSRGGSIVGANKRFGGQGGIAKTPGGDIYVGRNGNVHKLDPKSNTWQTRQGNTWQNTGTSQLKRSTPATGGIQGKIDTSRRPTAATRPATPATRPATRPATPAVRPTPKPAVRPTPKPAVRPTPKPAVRPTPKPAVRPTPKPTVRPTARPSTSQLDRQAFSRHRGTQTTQRSATRSVPSRSTRSAPSRGGGGSRGGRR